MIIRDLRAEDRPQWDGLWRGYLAFYKSELAPEVSEVTFARLLDSSEPMFALVADEDGVLLGFVHCVLHRGTWSIEDFCYLEDLFTAPAVRKRGVGRALIEAVYARADELNCSRVYWLTHEANAAGRSLYDKVARNLGFIQYRRG
ncbi:MAG: GNAT family N-acetyltransferase [Alphaproteobacteria bacterium]|nr:MAG: GNAT family N-acetyltransferase [Alphaproteobacteria bacterium]